MSDTPTTEDVLSLLSELGSAWRGDWNDFDGRQLRAELDDLYPYSRGEKTREQVRAMWGVCPHGGGHWTYYCGDYDCGKSE